MRAEPVAFDLPAPTFRARLLRAGQEGILWGVKLGLALGLILVAVSYVLGDYSIVRQRALNGQRAFEFLQQQQTARPSPPAPSPQKGP